MNVQENEYGVKYCTEDTTVLWGTHRDTICFAFMGKQRCFESVHDSTWRKLSEDDRVKFRSAESHVDETNQTYIVQDHHFGEIYSIKFIMDRKSASFSFLITNLQYGQPSYVLSYGPKRATCP